MVNRGRVEHPVADVLVLVGFHKGKADHISQAIAAGGEGQLPLKGHQLLQDPARRIHRSQQLAQLLEIGDGAGASAVVAPLAGLRHQGELETLRQVELGEGGGIAGRRGGGEGGGARRGGGRWWGAGRWRPREPVYGGGGSGGGGEIGCGRQHRLQRTPLGRRQVQIVQQLALGSLADQRRQGLQGGKEGHARLRQGRQGSQRQPFVLEADRPAAARQIGGGRPILQRGNHGAGGTAHRWIITVGRLHMQLQAEGHGSLRKHPRQLTAADDADAGEGLGGGRVRLQDGGGHSALQIRTPPTMGPIRAGRARRQTTSAAG